MPTGQEALLAQLDAFLGFARRRLRDPDLAADAVQDALAKALARHGDLDDESRLLPWFWRILRNTINDAGGRRRGEDLPADLAALPPEEGRSVCACLGAALAALPERQRVPLQRIDLDGEDAEAVAAELGLSQGNLKVLRHRARAVLREGLEALCRDCAPRHCDDCSCPPASS